MIKNQSGLSLIEVTIAAAISIMVALGIAKMSQNANKSMKKIKTDTELGDFKNFLKSTFSNSDKCSETFEEFKFSGSSPGNPHGATGITLRDHNSETDPPIFPSFINEIGAPGSTLYYPLSASDEIKFLDIALSVKDAPLTEDDGIAEDVELRITMGSPIPGYPNWTMQSMRIYQMTNESGPNNESGLCPIWINVDRKDINDSTIGAKSLNFWMILKCKIDLTSSTPTKELTFCTENQAIVPGFWTLQNELDPVEGIRYDGDVYVGSHLIIESDENIKINEAVIEDASSRVSKLNGYTYYMDTNKYPFKNYSEKQQLGLLAQEVESHFPEAVNTNKKTGLKSVRYSMLIPVLIEAHKEQEEKIRNQEIKIKQLENNLNKLIRQK